MEDRDESARPHRPDLKALLRRTVIIPVLAIITVISALAFGLAPELLAGNDSSRTGLSPTQTATTTTAPAPSAAPSTDGRPSSPATPSPSSVAPPSESASAPADTGQTAVDEVTVPDASGPTRLTIGAAGIDVAVLPLTPTSSDIASQSIVPPFTIDGYWLTSYGKPGEGSQNTTYITGHSWEDRQAPFDRLSTHTEIGDQVTVTTSTGTLTYVIDSITTHDKDTLKNSDIWNIVPNRLVLISCYTDDPWGKNVVVTASPTP